MGVRHTHATSSPPGAWAEPCQATSLSLDAAEGGVSSGDKLVGICIDAIGGGYTYTSLAMCLLRCVSCDVSLAIEVSRAFASNGHGSERRRATGSASVVPTCARCMMHCARRSRHVAANKTRTKRRRCLVTARRVTRAHRQGARRVGCTCIARGFRDACDASLLRVTRAIGHDVRTTVTSRSRYI